MSVEKGKFSLGKLICKVVFAVVSYGAYTFLQVLFRPIVTNQVAVNQLNSSNEGFIAWAAYQWLWDIGWLIWAIAVILLFLKEFKFFIQWVKQQI